ncbi:MAG: hypothetical protein M1829_001672 [Trizodia sp. TS-e1964]|nr:MAG: hypothetical protein M1829_001672 [Trizodia sp. TS-e1964]
MPASFKKILNSRLFKFIVGEKVDGGPTEFFVHEEAVAQLSKPLRTLMQGGMAESQTGCTIWADVSKKTFESFIQFAYTGDYSIMKGGKRSRDKKKKKVVTDDSSSRTSHSQRSRWAKTVVDLDLVAETPAPELEPGLVEKKDPETAIKKDKKKSLKLEKVFSFSPFGEESLRPSTDPDLPKPETIKRRDKYPELQPRVHSEDFNSLTFQLLAPRNNYDKTCKPAEHFDPDQCYTEIFLSHASLYILGDLQLVDSLKALALFKLHKTLCVFQLDDGNAEDIIALAMHAYSEEGRGGGLDEGIGGLRSLVCQYMATNALVMSFNDGFMDLLGDGGQLVQDFFKYEVQRMC